MKQSCFLQKRKKKFYPGYFDQTTKNEDRFYYNDIRDLLFLFIWAKINDVD